MLKQHERELRRAGILLPYKRDKPNNLQRIRSVHKSQRWWRRVPAAPERQYECISLDCLCSVDRYVVELRFGLHNGYEYTLEQIGDAMHLSRERVRQLEARALTRLKNYFEQKP